MRYAPAERFSVDLVHGSYGVAAVGFAAPARGPLPAGLRLMAGSALVAATHAMRFSATAAKSGVRLGWCGFQISDLSLAVAGGNNVEICCAASGAVLANWSPEAVFGCSKTSVEQGYQTVPEFRSAIRAAYGCANPTQIVPFGERMLRLQGQERLAQACYEWVFRSVPTQSKITETIEAMPVGWTSLDLLQKLIGTDEFERLGKPVMLGPFEPGFPFDLAALDA